MRERHKDESIRLNYGSLYTVVQGLARHRMIDPAQVQREGNRPERTVFELTDAGRMELIDWLAELLCQPVRDYTQFEAGLSLLPVLPPADAAGLLRQRCERIEIELAQAAATRDLADKRDLPRLFLIESEYRWHLRNAELAFIKSLVADIESGTLDGLVRWRTFHGTRASGADILRIEPTVGRKARD